MIKIITLILTIYSSSSYADTTIETIINKLFQPKYPTLRYTHNYTYSQTTNKQGTLVYVSGTEYDLTDSIELSAKIKSISGTNSPTIIGSGLQCNIMINF